jgi:hypothetical protein
LIVGFSILSEYENMMNGGMWGIGWMGGDGGIWVPILVAILAVGFVAWFINGRRK